MTDTSAAIRQILASGRIVLATMTACCLLYGLVILGFGQAAAPGRANGSLVYNEKGEIAGSALIAQKFTRPEYFWPRPSAVDYDASSAGGSNLSPANPELRAKAQALIAKLGATAENRVPADLVTASGSGLDPHITLSAAKYQAGRVAAARGLPPASVTGLLEKCAERPGGALTPEPVVNVLDVNRNLDRLGR